ncbi:MAG: hypothetical protein ACREP9_05720 [Candidatus Dormibacteraceae bacterium]
MAKPNRRGTPLRATAGQAAVWTDAAPIAELPAGRSLVIEDERLYTLHFGMNEWQQVAARVAVPFGIVYRVRLRRDELRGRSLHFTRYYPEDDRWEGVDHLIRIERGPARSTR